MSRLSRRDRAALSLALCCLRAVDPADDSPDERAADALSRAYDVLALGGNGRPAIIWHWARRAARLTPWRPLRARLALYLRALLRADAPAAYAGEGFDDLGAWWGVTFADGMRPTFVEHSDAQRFASKFTIEELKVTRVEPLWSLAPSARTSPKSQP